MNRSETIGKIAEALCKAQKAFKNAVKDSENPYFNSKYADLTSVFDACREELEANGLSVSQPLSSTPEGKPVVNTLLMHTSGEWISSSLVMNPVKMDPQGLGSSITYGRRFSLESILAIAREESDDDGNAASTPPKTVSAESPAGGVSKPPPATPPKGKKAEEGTPISFMTLRRDLDDLLAMAAAKTDTPDKVILRQLSEYTGKKDGKLRWYETTDQIKYEWQFKKYINELNDMLGIQPETVAEVADEGDDQDIPF